MSDKLLQNQSNHDDAETHYSHYATQDSREPSLAKIDKLGKKSFAEALMNIPNVGTDADFQRIK